MLLDRGLTVASYKIIAEKLNDKVGYTLMPPYSHVQMEKINAEPKNIIGDKNNVQVPLTDVLQHTVKRICDQEDVEDVMNDLARKNGNKLPSSLVIIFLFIWYVKIFSLENCKYVSWARFQKINYQLQFSLIKFHD